MHEWMSFIHVSHESNVSSYMDTTWIINQEIFSGEMSTEAVNKIWFTIHITHVNIMLWLIAQFSFFSLSYFWNFAILVCDCGFFCNICLWPVTCSALVDTFVTESDSEWLHSHLILSNSKAASSFVQKRYRAIASFEDSHAVASKDPVEGLMKIYIIAMAPRAP